MKLWPYLFLFFSRLALAESRWDLQVTDPQFELKNHKLSNSEEDFKPFLAKTSWRCYVGGPKINQKIEVRSLTCDYSVEKTGKVTTFVSCSPQKKYGEGILELYDQRKDLTFKIMLTCRYNK